MKAHEAYQIAQDVNTKLEDFRIESNILLYNRMISDHAKQGKMRIAFTFTLGNMLSEREYGFKTIQDVQNVVDHYHELGYDTNYHNSALHDMHQITFFIDWSKANDKGEN